MAISRRALGFGLLAAGVGGTAAVSLLGGEKIQNLITGERADQVSLWGFIGGEKVDFIRNQKVVDLLRRRHGVTLDARRAGSVEMVSDPALTGQNPQWLWPASSVMVQLARRSGLAVRRDDIVFNSPLVLYSWSPVVEALIAAGYVEKRENAYYVVKMDALMQAIASGTSWKDIGVPQLFGRVIVTSTDPLRSNSGFAFAALLANLFAGDVANNDTLARDIPRIASIFQRMGYKEPSSGTHFNSYLNEGMGGKPIIVAYENQLIEFILANPDRWAALQAGKIRPVMLYPQPTVTSSHPIISLTSDADRLVTALTDPELQELAWSEHGFRSRLGELGQGGPKVDMLAPQVSSVTPIPDAETMLALVGKLTAG